MIRLPLGFRLGLPEVEVDIGGAPLRLLVDTGASAAISLHADHLALPGVRIGDARASYGDAVGRRFEARRFEVATLSLGALTFSSVAGVESVFVPEFAPPNRAGFIGRSLFDGYRVLFDHPRAELTLFDGPRTEEETAIRAGASADLEVAKDGWVLAGTLDGMPARMLLDTCSTHSLLSGRSGSGSGSGTVRTLRAGSVVHEALALAEVELRGPGVDGILGANFFAPRRVLIDVQAGRVWCV